MSFTRFGSALFGIPAIAALAACSSQSCACPAEPVPGLSTSVSIAGTPKAGTPGVFAVDVSELQHGVAIAGTYPAPITVAVSGTCDLALATSQAQLFLLPGTPGSIYCPNGGAPPAPIQITYSGAPLYVGWDGNALPAGSGLTATLRGNVLPVAFPSP